MKLIEVVVLMGAHCISPVQSSEAATDVAKVQCAVVIEKDTDAGTIRIVPAGASREPQVAAVLERLDGDSPAAAASGTTIQPAFAPPGSAAAAVPDKALTSPAPPPAPAAPAAAEEPSTEAASAEPAADVEDAPAKPEKPAPPVKAKAKKDKTEKPAAAAKPSSKCKGSAQPKWYTNDEGRRKYRCVLPG